MTTLKQMVFQVVALSALCSPVAVLRADEFTIRICEPEEHLGILEPETRIEWDALRILKDAGNSSLQADIPKQMKQLFGFSKNATFKDRLDSAVLLRGVAEQLDSRLSHLRGVRRQILRRVEFHEAGIHALQQQSHDEESEATRLFNELVLAATIDFEFGGREVYGNIVHKRLMTLRNQFPQIHAAMKPIVDKHCMGSNLRLVISEPMATKIVNKPDSRSDSIADCILGACVTGSQSTTVNPEADIIPSMTSATWKVIGHGKTFTKTRAVKGPATVCSEGNHCFTASRVMSIAGASVAFGTPNIFVNANNRNVGLSTRFDRVPLVRGIVRKIVWNQANQKRPQSEAIAARKLANQALPEFEEKSSADFMDLNRRVSRAVDLRRRYVGQSPAIDSYSTDTHLFINSRTASPINLAGSPPTTYPLPETTLTFQIHESLLNAIIDAFGVYGEEQTDALLHKLREQLRENPQFAAELNAEELRKRLIHYLNGLNESGQLASVLPLAGDWMRERLGDNLAQIIVPELRPDQLTKPLKDLLDDTEIIDKLNLAVTILKAAGIPNLRFKDCDPIRIRIDEGELVLVFHSGPRKNEKLPKEFPLSLIIENGELGLAGLDLPDDEELPELLRPFYQKFRPRAEAELNKLQSSVRKMVKDGIKQIAPDSILDTPDHLDLYFVNAVLSDGWLTLEVGAR